MTAKTFADFGIEVPHGRTGEVDTTCPECSPQRKKKNARCLSVNLDKGCWYCAHCGWSGGLGTGEQSRPVIVKTWRKPQYRTEEATPTEQAYRWFAARGITQEVLKRNCVGVCSAYFPQLEDRASAVTFPYLRGDEVLNVKYRTKDKHFRMEAGAERVLYGLNDIAETLIWVEGEMDKLSVEVAGFTSCVSVPDGAPTPNTKNYDSKFDFMDAPELERAKFHIIAVDNDEPGVRLEEELLRRLGRDTCKVVRWPAGCKDANDVLKAHGPETLAQCINAAQWVPVEGEHAVSEYADNMDRLYRYGLPQGLRTGWESVNDLYTVMPGEWTLVTGIPGHGKSEWLDAMMVGLAQNHGWCFAIFSPENQPTEYHISKLAEKYIGKPFGNGPSERMTPSEKDAAVQFLDEHFVFLMPELPTVEVLIERLRSIVKRRGVRGVVLDPWNEIDHTRVGGLSETEYISQSLSKLRSFARSAGVHLWIVAHPTKLQKEQDGSYPVPTPYDVAGCHDEKTEVLTAQGWIPHAMVTMEHDVCCFDPATSCLVYQKPTKLWKFAHDGDMVRIQSPSFDALVTPNHRMVVKAAWTEKPSFASRYRGSGMGRPQKYDGQWQFLEAREIAGDLLMPWASPLAVNPAEFAVADDVLRFIGWWIAEGWETRGSVALCQAVGPVADKMRACLDRLGYPYTENVTHYRQEEKPMWKARLRVRYHDGANAFAKMVLAECGIGCANKRLPAFTWSLSQRQKSILLDAYLEGDGSVGRKDTFRAATTSRQLADDVQRLCIEMGRMASVSDQGKGAPHHKTRYTISIGRQDRNTITLRRSRHVSAEHYMGNVYCLTVPTGAYLVRRHGKPGIYGNSAHWRNKADNCIAVWRDTAKDTRTVEVHVQKVRKKSVGKVGMATLVYDRVTGQYHDVAAAPPRWANDDINYADHGDAPY